LVFAALLADRDLLLYPEAWNRTVLAALTAHDATALPTVVLRPAISEGERERERERRYLPAEYGE
jgi:hypothetical protein